MTWNGPQFGVDQPENSFAIYLIEMYAKIEKMCDILLTWNGPQFGMDLNSEWIDFKIAAPR